ncbi:MAG TPA: hypothetical protein VGL13_08020, partial [Polyangiaceae bacterium]
MSSSRPSVVPSTKPQKSTSGDSLAGVTIRALGLRIGIPVVIVWIIGIAVGKIWSIGAAVALTAAAAALVIWLLQFTKKRKAVADLVQNAQTPAARKEALAKLATDFKKGDTAAIFARAQLELQEDPRKALATLENIDLGKVMTATADEARTQRAMIHLILGEPDRARQLVDAIDLSRHQQAKSRAMMGSVIGEAWA